jgi:hypothetical protein
MSREVLPLDLALLLLTSFTCLCVLAGSSLWGCLVFAAFHKELFRGT